MKKLEDIQECVKTHKNQLAKDYKVKTIGIPLIKPILKEILRGK